MVLWKWPELARLVSTPANLCSFQFPVFRLPSMLSLHLRAKLLTVLVESREHPLEESLVVVIPLASVQSHNRLSLVGVSVVS